MPLGLPGQFYNIEEARKAGNKRKTWTDGLVWDPKEDAFDTAYRKVLERAKEIAMLADQDLVSCVLQFKST